MIVVTGAAGFIGSCLVSRLNRFGHTEIIAVDHFTGDKCKNLQGKKIKLQIDRSRFFDEIRSLIPEIDFVFHFGAITNTLLSSKTLFAKWNTEYSKSIWGLCTTYKIPLIYASSAATYGLGEAGFTDNEQNISRLRPLNDYAVSKHTFDLWAVSQPESPPYWAGLKFFNVFGPNEYHKGSMASMIFQAFHQIKTTNEVRLFKSYLPDYADGDQERDFIYIKDVVEICIDLMDQRMCRGILNLGTGRPVTFNQMVKSIFDVMNMPECIKYIDMPTNLRSVYQYSTRAFPSKLSEYDAGNRITTSFVAAVENYVSDYLITEHFY